ARVTRSAVTSCQSSVSGTGAERTVGPMGVPPASSRIWSRAEPCDEPERTQALKRYRLPLAGVLATQFELSSMPNAVRFAGPVILRRVLRSKPPLKRTNDDPPERPHPAVFVSNEGLPTKFGPGPVAATVTRVLAVAAPPSISVTVTRSVHVPAGYTWLAIGDACGPTTTPSPKSKR